MDFLILRPLSPETGYHFWGGSKVCAQKDLNQGQVEQSLSAGRCGGRSAGRESNRRPDGCRSIALLLDR